MDSSKQAVYRFEDVEIDFSRECLKRNGVERHLRKKAFQVLYHLVENHDRVVTKEELISRVWQDAFVTDDVLVQCIKDIRRALADKSQTPRFIKTIPKSGYRFIGEIEEASAESSEKPLGSSKTAPTPQKSKRFFEKRFAPISALALAALLLIFGLGGIALWQGKFSAAEAVLPQTPGKKTLAIMFFENQSNSTELDWLREGLTDMLITNLTRSQKITVLSRQQLQLLLERNGYRNGDEINLETAQEIARRARAEFVILGSFIRLGEKVRLDARLHNAENGTLETAESLTVDNPESILTEIDLLSFKLLSRFGAAEQENPVSLASAMTNNLEAYRYYSLALEKARGMHKKDTLELFEKAIALDPEFAMAHARIGHTYAVTWGWTEKAKPHLERAFQLSERLTEKDRLYIAAWYGIANLDYPSAIQSLREIIQKYPTETEAYLRLGYLLRGEEREEEAIGAFRQGLAIDPDSAALYNALGLLYSLMGRHEEAIQMHQRYVALEPTEPNAHDSLGLSYQWAGRYEEAISEYYVSLELNQNFEIAYVHIGTAYFQTGRYRMAIDWYKKYIERAPSKMESSRGFSHIAHVYRKLNDLPADERAAERAFTENEAQVWERVAVGLEKGDKATVDKLQQKLFAESVFNNRGSRAAQRYPFYYRGYLALKNNQPERAIENFRQSLQLSPGTWDIDALEDSLGKTYLQLRRYDEAIAEFERVLRLNPNYPLARFHLAQIYEQKGQLDEARENYRLFLQIWQYADPDIPEVLAARKFLQKS